jgi:hypothetical protein
MFGKGLHYHSAKAKADADYLLENEADALLSCVPESGKFN